MHKVNRDIGLKKKRKKEHLHENFEILLLLLLFCFVLFFFVFFLLFVTIIIFLFLCVCEQLTGRAHNEVNKMKLCSMMKLGILVAKRKGCGSVSSRSFKCGEQEKKERAFHSFTHPIVIPCCASGQ